MRIHNFYFIFGIGSGSGLKRVSYFDPVSDPNSKPDSHPDSNPGFNPERDHGLQSGPETGQNLFFSNKMKGTAVLLELGRNYF